MIELNDKTQQDFLNREWVQKLLDAGVDMSDAKYCIVEYHNYDVVFYKNSIFTTNETVTNIIPTYTTSELLNKLQDWIDEFLVDYSPYVGYIEICKEKAFYEAYFDTPGVCIETLFELVHAEPTPIETLAVLLVNSYKHMQVVTNKQTNNQ